MPPASIPFARLKPANDAAEKAFCRSIEDLQINGNEFHLKFYESAAALDGTTKSSSSILESSEYDSDVELYKRAPQPRGHFLLSFDIQPGEPIQGWRVGKGNTKKEDAVDFRLARPRDPVRRHIAIVHLFLRFNPRSGLLMVVTASDTKSVDYLVDGQWKEMVYPERCVLYQSTNRIRLRDLEYELEYVPHNQQDLDRYTAHRNNFLRNVYGSPPPSPGIDALPTKYGIRKHGNFLIYNTLAYGSFGWVFAGVDISTGEPVAVKEVSVKRQRDILAVREEFEFGHAFLGVPGVLPLIDCKCEHNRSLLSCGRVPEKFYLISPLAHADFRTLDWTKVDYKTRLTLLQKSLEGLGELHQRGIMHRDISQKNLLAISMEPPEAAVCDYGKALEADSSNFTYIGPIPTLAPEVYAGTYTNRIDIWAWAYAIAETLGYETPSDAGRINLVRHQKLLDFLEFYRAVFSERSSLTALLEKMLAWNPDDRPSVADALKHHCWHMSYDDSQSSIDDALRTKRIKVGDSSGSCTLLIEAEGNDNDHLGPPQAEDLPSSAKATHESMTSSLASERKRKAIDEVNRKISSRFGPTPDGDDSELLLRR